ncbi:NAC domain containing protein 94 [Dorcoceras hygrometricum]|nr:NAC domain containing protein 94 [Dorcoceras hygrometricum]
MNGNILKLSSLVPQPHTATTSTDHTRTRTQRQYPVKVYYPTCSRQTQQNGSNHHVSTTQELKRNGRTIGLKSSTTSHPLDKSTQGSKVVPKKDWTLLRYTTSRPPNDVAQESSSGRAAYSIQRIAQNIRTDQLLDPEDHATLTDHVLGRSRYSADHATRQIPPVTDSSAYYQPASKLMSPNDIALPPAQDKEITCM